MPQSKCIFCHNLTQHSKIVKYICCNICKEIKTNFNVKCSNCLNNITCNSYQSYTRLLSKLVLCNECKYNRYIRKCPKCDIVIKYNNQPAFIQANKRQSSCSDCFKKSHIGCGNAFYGKKHTQKTKEILRKKRTSVPLPPKQKQKAIENLKKYGNKRHFYEIWLEKYGKEEADKRMLVTREKQSRSSSGQNNSMYGRSPGHGAGAGWSGWYKGHFFRSLLELSVMLDLDADSKIWITAESQQFKIPYIDVNGKLKNYFPDFFVDNHILIECKPIKLQLTPINIIKKEALRLFCQNNGLLYLILDKKIEFNLIHQAVNDGLVVFTQKTKEKYNATYNNMPRNQRQW